MVRGARSAGGKRHHEEREHSPSSTTLAHYLVGAEVITLGGPEFSMVHDASHAVVGGIEVLHASATRCLVALRRLHVLFEQHLLSTRRGREMRRERI